jgi:hypothetical protein
MLSLNIEIKELKNSLNKLESENLNYKNIIQNLTTKSRSLNSPHNDYTVSNDQEEDDNSSFFENQQANTLVEFDSDGNEIFYDGDLEVNYANNHEEDDNYEHNLEINEEEADDANRVGYYNDCRTNNHEESEFDDFTPSSSQIIRSDECNNNEYSDEFSQHINIFNEYENNEMDTNNNGPPVLIKKYLFSFKFLKKNQSVIKLFLSLKEKRPEEVTRQPD